MVHHGMMCIYSAHPQSNNIYLVKPGESMSGKANGCWGTDAASDGAARLLGWWNLHEGPNLQLPVRE